MDTTLNSAALRGLFKRCPTCQAVWATPADFLKDAGLRCIGNQEGVETGNLSLVMFNHSCGTTLAIKRR